MIEWAKSHDGGLHWAVKTEGESSVAHSDYSILLKDDGWVIELDFDGPILAGPFETLVAAKTAYLLMFGDNLGQTY